MFLYHYYDKKTGPFMNITAMPQAEAEALLDRIRQEKPDSMCAKRQATYIADRLAFESLLRSEFIKKGGHPERMAPHYMVVEACPWLETWYEDVGCLKIPVMDFDLNSLTFTYGDSHPTFSPRVTDGKEYRKKLYTYEEILPVIAKYGLPQDWNADGKFGPERYVEVQIWDDRVINSDNLQKYMEGEK